MKPSSAKQKGRLFQQLVRDKLYEAFPELEEGDIRSTSMGAGGSDLQLSPKAAKLIPFAFECKARKSAKGLYDWLDQAKAGGKGTPVVVVKGDRREPLVLLSFSNFLGMIKNGQD